MTHSVNSGLLAHVKCAKKLGDGSVVGFGSFGGFGIGRLLESNYDEGTFFFFFRRIGIGKKG